METVTLPGLPGHTITLEIDGAWLSCEVRDSSGEVRYSAGWDTTPTA
ncbi:hypothetical protein MWT96_20900 [Prescottella equi]|nr:hypothetical protein [Prescottella equi]UPH36624.1 hypothetical protein GS533_000800 [Prescottella equi]UPH40925.1 hypothetical protein MWT96_20900 [Prescottella equi]